MDIDGKPHPHSFVKNGEETRTVQVDATEGVGIDIKTGIRGLTVLKSTNSQFWGFLRDEYTTLPETWDRVLSTDVAADWQWKRLRDLEDVRANVPKFDSTWTAARDITLKTFAEDNSASVQNTMYKMADEILAYQPLVETVEYSLPNKHYFEIGMFPFYSADSWNLDSNFSPDLSWHKDLKNTGENAEVYAPQTNPNGLIKCTVDRSSPGQVKGKL